MISREQILTFIQKMQGYWKTVTLQVSLVATLVLYLVPYFIPSIAVDDKWIFSAIYLGILSIAFMLLDMYELLLNRKDVTSFPNMKAAEPEILRTIERSAKRKRSGPLEVKILGNRLSRISIMVTDIFRMSNEGRLGSNKIEITIYHTDPSVLLHEDYLPVVNAERITDDKHQSHSLNLISNIRWLTQESGTYPNVSVKFVKSSPIPYFYAYLIDQQHLFWGYFRWDEELSDWVGPSNPCFYTNNKSDETEFVKWMKNRLKIYDIIFDKDT